MTTDEAAAALRLVRLADRYRIKLEGDMEPHERKVTEHLYRGLVEEIERRVLRDPETAAKLKQQEVA